MVDILRAPTAQCDVHLTVISGTPSWLFVHDEDCWWCGQRDGGDG